MGASELICKVIQRLAPTAFKVIFFHPLEYAELSILSWVLTALLCALLCRQVSFGLPRADPVSSKQRLPLSRKR